MRGNTVSLKGNVTRDCEVRRVGDSNAVSWGVAWNSRRKNRQTGDYEDVPHFFDVECWMSDRQLAMMQDQIVKGARCAIVDGHLEQQRWEKDGQARSKVVVKVDDPIAGMLLALPAQRQDGSGRQDGGYRPQYAQAEVYDAASVYDSDLPF